MMSSPARPPTFLQRHQLASYFGVTFAISWAVWLGLIVASLPIQTPTGAVLNIVAIAGPSIAALVLTTQNQPEEDARVLRVSMLLQPGQGEAAPAEFLRHRAAQEQHPHELGQYRANQAGWPRSPSRLPPSALPAWPDSRYPGCRGVGRWHRPLYFVLGTGQSEIRNSGTSPAFAIGGFIGWTIGLSVLFTWLFNQTGGSLIVVILFHAAVNMAAFLPAAVGSGGAAPLLNVVITWLVAIGVVVRCGRARLTSRPRVEVATAR